jgi:hypothetical protein
LRPFVIARQGKNSNVSLDSGICDDLLCEVEKELTGRESESWEIYFKLYKSQIPVIEQALETAALMLGGDARLLSGDDLRGLFGRSQFE